MVTELQSFVTIFGYINLNSVSLQSNLKLNSFFFVFGRYPELLQPNPTIKRQKILLTLEHLKRKCQNRTTKKIKKMMIQ